jgi:hypothetical protein
MAKEMTLQLRLAVPSCEITFAPSIQLARSILLNASFHLVISSPILPDGSATSLSRSLADRENQPDLVVVGNAPIYSAKNFEEVGYHLSTVRRRSVKALEETSFATQIALPLPEPTRDNLKTLGEDIRNDLNNPLQEIVTMVFVARTDSARSETTAQALEAIQKAATNMAEYVREIEGKIRQVVEYQSFESSLSST